MIREAEHIGWRDWKKDRPDMRRKAGGIRRGPNKQPVSYTILDRSNDKIIFVNDREEKMIISEIDADLLRFYWKKDMDGYPARGRWSAEKNYSIPERLHKVVAKRMGIDVPKKTIDHRDRDKCNSERSNLRSISQAFNNINKGLSFQNKTGVSGVSRPQRSRKWLAICKPHRQYFEKFEDAVAQRKIWEAERLAKFELEES